MITKKIYKFKLGTATDVTALDTLYPIVRNGTTVTLSLDQMTPAELASVGVQGITKTLAIELGPYGVTVNAVAPGFIETEMTAATATRMGVSFEELKETFAADIPVRRVGQPRDIAAAIAFFASEEASFVSGQVLYVAGGPKA